MKKGDKVVYSNHHWEKPEIDYIKKVTFWWKWIILENHAGKFKPYKFYKSTTPMFVNPDNDNERVFLYSDRQYAELRHDYDYYRRFEESKNYRRN